MMRTLLFFPLPQCRRRRHRQRPSRPHRRRRRAGEEVRCRRAGAEPARPSSRDSAFSLSSCAPPNLPSSLSVLAQLPRPRRLRPPRSRWLALQMMLLRLRCRQRLQVRPGGAAPCALTSSGRVDDRRARTIDVSHVSHHRFPRAPPSCRLAYGQEAPRRRREEGRGVRKRCVGQETRDHVGSANGKDTPSAGRTSCAQAAHALPPLYRARVQLAAGHRSSAGAPPSRRVVTRDSSQFPLPPTPPPPPPRSQTPPRPRRLPRSGPAPPRRLRRPQRPRRRPPRPLLRRAAAALPRRPHAVPRPRPLSLPLRPSRRRRLRLAPLPRQRARGLLHRPLAVRRRRSRPRR
jgi:hypothetical protein